MSENVTSATQNHMTTSSETFEKSGFPTSPIDTATPQENQRLETRHMDAEKLAFPTRLPLSYETSSNFHSWQHDKRRSFAASTIDTARPPENQRRETRHVGAPKRAFRARLPPILTLCSFKIDVFLRVFLSTSKFATAKSTYRARLL